MKKNKLRFEIFFCSLIVIASGLLCAPGTAHCQDAAKITIRSHVVDTGGDVVRSENYRLHFSLGQPLHGGESADTGKTLSAGFVASMVRVAKESQTKPDGDTGGSGGGSSCFIRTSVGH